MSKISTYPIASPTTGNEKLLGSDATVGEVTKNYTVDSVSDRVVRDVTEYNLPMKEGAKMENSPLSYDSVNDKLVSTVSIEVPPGSVEVGQNLVISSAGTLPLFKSAATGNKFFVPLWNWNASGNVTKAFIIDIGAETEQVNQSVFDTVVPLSGSFPNPVTQNIMIQEIRHKTTPSGTVNGLRLKASLQSTSYPLYYFPSKAKWEAGTGADLTAGVDGIIKFDIREAPLALGAGENVIVEYAYTSGSLLGNSSNVPYNAITIQSGPQDYIVTENDQWHGRNIFVVSDVTNDETIVPADDGKFKYYDPTSVDINVTLPLLSSVPLGYHITFANRGTKDVIISPVGSDKIGGSLLSTIKIRPRFASTLVKDGTPSWFVQGWDKSSPYDFSTYDYDPKQAGDMGVDTSSFNKHLSAADDTIQKALNTLDDSASSVAKFTDLTDTPSDHNTPGIYNVVNNPFIQKLEYREAQLSDNKDIQISAPADGELLHYDEGSGKWINDEPRISTAISTYLTDGAFDEWQDSQLSVVVVDDNNIVNIDTPSVVRTLDNIVAINANTISGRNIVINARAGFTINGTSSYSVPPQKAAVFQLQPTHDFRFHGSLPLLTTLTTHSVTELNDVTDAGSGKIITDAERAKLAALGGGELPLVVTANFTITDLNYTTYNKRLVDFQKPSGDASVTFLAISAYPDVPMEFSFTNNSPVKAFVQLVPNGGQTIGGDAFCVLKWHESVTVEKPVSTATNWLIKSRTIQDAIFYDDATAEAVLNAHYRNQYIKYGNFLSGATIIQNIPEISDFENGDTITFGNFDSNVDHVVVLTPPALNTINGASDYTIPGNGGLIKIVADVAAANWIIESADIQVSPFTGLELDDGPTNIASVKKITFGNGVLGGDSNNATYDPAIIVGEVGGDYTLVQKTKEIEVVSPLEVTESNPNVAQIVISPGAYEQRSAPGYYATLNDETEVAGRKTTGIRTGVLWFEDVIKPSGVFIQVDRTNKRIGLQEDDFLDPNVTGGTPYLIHYRVALKGTAPAAGYVQIYLRDATTLAIVEDWKGEPIGVKKVYAIDEPLGVLEVSAIRKYTAIEYFQMVVEETFDGEELVIEDRTEGNSCILVQALDTDYKTSMALLQCENDLAYNFEFTSHYLGNDLFTLQWYLKDEIPLTTIAPGVGETNADGWHFYNWTQLKTGITSNELTITDDGVNLVGFSFGNILSAEKTQLLRGHNVDVSITLKTPDNAANVYAAKWTGVPDQYTKAIVTDMTGGSTPVLEPNWTLLPSPIFCVEDPFNNFNTRTGSFIVPADAENFAILIIPIEEQQPTTFVINDFHLDANPSFNGYFLHAPQIGDEQHLEFDNEFFECGLNTQGYAALRYTINATDTPLPAGVKVKGNADITPNWAGIGVAVDYLTFNKSGNASISTTYLVYPGESIPPAGDTEVSFWWSYESSPGVWTKIAESEKGLTVKKDETAPIFFTLPAFDYGVIAGLKLRAYAIAGINDGAYIQSTAPDKYLCQTTINFKELIGIDQLGDVFSCLSGWNTNTVTVPNTPITVTINVKSHEEGVSFNTTTGAMTILRTDCYTLQTMLNVQVSGATVRIIEIWIEVFNSGTSTWSPVPDSGYKREVSGSTEGGVSYIRIDHIMEGTVLRLRAQSSDATAVTFEAGTLTNGVVVPSIVFAVKN